MDAMARWTAATVVHYRVVGEFSGTVNILSLRDRATVTDRVEIEFDWNQTENTLVGKPVIRNLPTKVDAIVPLAGCPAPKVNGAFEFITILSVKDQPDETMRRAAAGIVIEGRRDHPAGEAPVIPNQAEAPCGSTWEKAAARSEVTSEVLTVPLAMMLAMGKAGGANITPDGKSFMEKFGAGTRNAGWTWTYTPTIVK
jgi:hypothetical protein